MKLTNTFYLSLTVQASCTLAFHTAHIATKLQRQRTSLAVSGSYLDQLSAQIAQQAPSIPAPAADTTTTDSSSSTSGISYASPDYFAFSNLQSKGPRAGDWGTPTEATRKLDDDGMLRVGAWYCSEGGWPSPNQKAHTEIFYVLEGQACLTDADGMKHYFGPGDTVVIPKGHTGRWDVYEPIRKIWAVNDHARIEEDTSKAIRVQVYHYCHLSPQYFSSITDDLLYTSSNAKCETLYEVGPTKVGVWTGESGESIAVSNGSKSFLYLLEGTVFVTNGDKAVRMTAGDTVMLPQWSGYVDVIESAKMLWTTAQ